MNTIEIGWRLANENQLIEISTSYLHDLQYRVPYSKNKSRSPYGKEWGKVFRPHFRQKNYLETPQFRQKDSDKTSFNNSTGFPEGTPKLSFQNKILI